MAMKLEQAWTLSVEGKRPLYRSDHDGPDLAGWIAGLAGSEECRYKNTPPHDKNQNACMWSQQL